MLQSAAHMRPGTRAFLIHLAVYAAVNAVLAALNFMQTPEEGAARVLWFQWPLLGWGIGVAAHGLALYLERRAPDGGLLADADVRGVAVHLFAYVAVNALLIVVNLTASPGTLWFVWPLLGWGAGIAAHGFLVYRAVTRRTVERYAAGQRALDEQRVEQLAAEIADAVEPAPQRKPARKRKAKTAQTGKTGARTTRKKPAAQTKAGKAGSAGTKAAAGRKTGTSGSASGKGARAGKEAERARTTRKRAPARKKA